MLGIKMTQPEYFIVVIMLALWLIHEIHSSPPENRFAGDRKGKFFPLFSFVTFKNSECTVPGSSSFGTCFSSSECNNINGIAMGKCASGFGVCCFVDLLTVSGIVPNSSYLQSPGYPQGFQTVSASFVYKLRPTFQDICSTRLDFDESVLISDAAASACLDSLTINVDGIPQLQGVCGDITNRIVYLPYGNTDFEFSFIPGPEFLRKWKAKVTFIECTNLMSPPRGCTQYHTGVSGTFSSDLINGQATGVFRYTICFRREKGYCGIEYSVNESSGNSRTAFQLGEDNTGVKGESCTSKEFYISIPSETSNSIYFCGSKFVTANNQTVSGVVRDWIPPFEVYVDYLNENLLTSTLNQGFSLSYNQIPC